MCNQLVTLIINTGAGPRHWPRGTDALHLIAGVVVFNLRLTRLGGRICLREVRDGDGQGAVIAEAGAIHPAAMYAP